MKHRHIFINKMATAALDGGNEVVTVAEKIFSIIHKQGLCTPEIFERGLLPIVKIAVDMSIDVPRTYEWLARLMHAASLNRLRVVEMAGKLTVLGGLGIRPKYVLVQEFDEVSAYSQNAS